MAEEAAQATEAPPAAEAAAAPAQEITPDLTGLGDIRVEVAAVLGTTQLPIEQFLKLGRGAIIELEQHRDAPLQIQINGYTFAKGEVRVLGDRVAFAVKEIIDHSKDLE